ncbi:MBL fold metallo-hydrolase [Pseudomonas sp. LRF_L74]|uniref:MBL fold metallo-hydrolase n=1 Tax=Pseudomonas sp. LRF_L74 TaxID=3369422 RepID=UPI003F61914A
MVQVESVFDRRTSTFSHLVHAGPGSACAVIDPVLGYDRESGRLDAKPADELLALIEARHLGLQWILETHVHADHLSAAAYLRERAGGRIATGQHVRLVQRMISERHGLPAGYCAASGQFDHLFAEDEPFHIGDLPARAWHVPGHTPADTAFIVAAERVFVGDTLFQPDIGTARCDFPGGSAQQLYRSIQRLLGLPGNTSLFMCHDYPTGREPRAVCTVAEQLANNVHIHRGVSEEQFVAWRQRRDAGLAPPALLKPATLLNIRAGVIPGQEVEGERYCWARAS